MRKLILILPFLIIAGCTNKSVYVPASYRVKKDTLPADKVDREDAVVTAGKKEEDIHFNSPYDKVFSAAVASVEFLKWPVAFAEQEEGSIRLKEAYVYNKNGKLFRSYVYPSKSDTSGSNINYYLERVAKYSSGTADTIYTQENLKITIKKVTDVKTDVKIDYSIRPYTLDGIIGYEVISNGYIETLIVDHMKDILGGKPVAMNK